MSVDYSYMLEGEAFFVVILWLIMMIPVVLVGLVIYILSSLGLYTIAKRRQLSAPWLSWVPVANSWILGSVSDQFRYVMKGEVRSKRKLLLGLNIAYWLLGLAMTVTTVVKVVTAVNNMVVFGLSEMEFMEDFMAAYSSMLILSLPLFGLSIAMLVIRYMALYDLYTSCDPQYKTVYLIVGILVNITEPFFIFACRNKDIGMPPRRVLPPPQPFACE